MFGCCLPVNRFRVTWSEAKSAPPGRPFVLDTTPKSIDSEELGESHTVT